ncbi:thioredoxin fold domain-containing protein [Pseudomonas sp. GCM10022186]|uniref:thioredoxin fold domain-containing protein n=1 Tax=Pseudomonas sp. GCM10022186 TaxID=3252650 RepID=UPI0036720D78
MRQVFFWVFALFAMVANAGSVEDISSAVKRSGLTTPIERIAPSSLPGLYQVELRGGRVLYSSPDGKYLMQGYLYEVQESGARNLTAELTAKRLAEMVKSLPESELVIYRAERERAQVTIFTDVECPFCHKLHEELETLNSLGVTVRYLAYPRKGLDTEAYKTMVAVWCAKDRQAAMDEAVDGDELRKVDCVNPVAGQYELGQFVGVQGTPTIIFGNGQLITGYRPAKELAEAAIAAGR